MRIIYITHTNRDMSAYEFIKITYVMPVSVFGENKKIVVVNTKMYLFNYRIPFL
jgi:hypothetical protein